MLLTEEQAKTKWCPLYRVATSGGDQSTFEIDNRPPEHVQPSEGGQWKPTGFIHPVACCIASECMAWRWIGKRSLDNTQWVEPVESGFVGTQQRRGCCGLAGKGEP